jgi:hypothetical protein
MGAARVDGSMVVETVVMGVSLRWLIGDASDRAPARER